MSKLIRLVGLCLFLLCLCKPSLVLSEAPLKKPTTQNIQTKKVSWGRVKLAIVNKDFGSALRWLKEIKPTASFSAEQKLFWLGRVQWQAKQYKASAKSLLQFVRTFPNSRLRSKAELMAAQALARSRRYGGAQKIFEKHLKRMLSPARRLEIARVYLRYANAYYKKAKAKNKFANYAKAIKMFKHSLGLGLPSKETRKVMLQLGTAYLRRNRKWMASATFEKAYKKYRKSRFAEQYVYYWALSQYKIGYSRKARRLLLEMLKEYPNAKMIPNAYFLMAQTYGLPGRVSKRQISLGVGVLRKLITAFPKHSLARKSAFRIAQTYYNNGLLDEAVRAYRHFVSIYGDVKKDPNRLLARSRYYTGQSYLLQKKFDSAIQAFQNFLKAHATDRLWPNVQRLIVTSRYRKAEQEFSRRHWKKARKLYLQFLSMYPLDRRNALVMSKLAEVWFQQKMYKQAISSWQRLSSKYPNSFYGRRAKLRIAETYERKLNQLERALKAYKKVRYYRDRYKARKAIRRLKGKGLQLLSPRVFGVKEGASLEATVRNIKGLRVRLYRVDAETYFRKMYRFSGMEKLDIQLIRPDKEWAVPIPNYQKLRQHKVKIALGQKKPMVAVVHVSGGKLEAATVAVVSHLQILSKASRHALFVFALHRITRKPMAGVKLLVSDGKRILFEGKTGKGGVFQIRSKKLRHASKLHVLAMHNGSIASSGSSLYGVSFSRGVQPAGVLYTDRPAYRPGDTVSVRGILREVKNGQFQLPEKPYQFEIVSPAGRTLFQTKVSAGSFGTIQRTFKISSVSPLGTYLVRLSRKNGPSFDGRFQVKKYRLPKYRLSLKLSQRVYQYGQTIRGTIVARYGFGAPAAGKLITYRMGPLRGKGTTNAKGEVRFQWSSRELELDKAYTIRAFMPGQKAKARAVVWMRTTAFDLGVTTVRNVYAAGERFEVTLRASDPLGKPQSASARLEWHQRRFVMGRWIETKMGEAKVEIGKLGRGSTSIQIKKGGSYTLRAFARDAAKQPVVASSTIFVSGDDDKVVLRLLSDRDKFNVGEKTHVTLLSRRAGTALITYEANEVLWFKLVPHLKKGSLALPLTFAKKLSPNFMLSVALLHKQKLHVVEKEFLVLKKLQISLKTKSKVWRPGQTVEVEVETKDQAGKPVSAEFSLAAVDRALLDLFPDTTPKLGAAFYRYKRKLKMVTRSSHTYRHQALTKKTIATGFQQRPRGGYHSRVRRYRRRGRTLSRFQRLRSRQTPKPRLQRKKLNRQSIHAPKSFLVPPRAQKFLNQLLKNNPVARTTGKGAGFASKLLRSRLAATAFWKADIVTPKSGRATVRFKLPDNLTTWVLVARGVAHPTLVGEAKASVVSKKDFFVQLRAPFVASDGDQIQPTVVVHNSSDQVLEVKLKLGMQQERSHTKVVSVPAKSSIETLMNSISTQGSGGKHVTLTLSAIGKAKNESWDGKNTKKDSVRHTLQVRIPGVRFQVGASGVVGENVSASLKLPGKAPLHHGALKLFLGPISSQWIVSVAEQALSSRWSLPGVAVHRASLAMTALRYLKQSGKSNSPAAKRLRTLLRRQVRSLRSLRRRWGSWNYAGTGSNSVFSADVFRVLVEAQKKWGVWVEAAELMRVRKAIKLAYSRAYRDEVKAILLSALVTQPQEESAELYSYANRLVRQRSQLSLEGLCHLGKTLLRLKRNELARELLPYLSSAWKKAARLGGIREKRRVWQVPRKAQAACAIGLMAKLNPSSKSTQQGIEWLLKERRGMSWSSLLMTRRALTALVSFYRNAQGRELKLNVDVLLNGKKIRTVRFTRESPFVTIRLQSVDLSGPIKFELKPQGLGKIHYAVTLTGYGKPQNASRLRRYHFIRRSYQPAFRRVGRKIFRPGFSVLRGRYKRWKNVVKQLVVGEYTRVKLRVSMRNSHRSNDNVVVEEELPAGTMVLPSSIHVTNGTYQLEDGKIRFFLYRNRRSWRIRYRLYATTAGTYRIPPTYVRSFAHSNRLTRGKPHVLTVVTSDKKPEKYRLTPNELYSMGQAYASKGKHREARMLLERLLSNYSLRYRYLGKVAQKLFAISRKQGPSSAIVKYFELLKEHSPNTVMPFQDILRVGEAYASVGEYERSFMLYQATIAARFLKELNVAQVLEKEGEFEAAVSFILSLTQQYPDLRTIQSGYYALAQSVFQYADKCKANEVKRKKWLRKAEKLLSRFVLLHPTHPSADVASYTRANVLLALDEKEAAIRFLKTLATRYPKSGYLADIHYLEAYSLYLQRRSARALTLLRRVSTKLYPNGRGGQSRSKNRYLASYLIAQIHHAADKLQKALVWYKRIQKRFSDAAVQVNYFQQVLLKIPEVQTLGPKSKVALAVRHQNIRDLTVLVYSVDLMKLYLLKKNLNAVTRINLAGIRPSYRGSKVLSKRREFGPRVSKLEMPLKRRGTYLVVLKSRQKEVSGIILRTALTMDVQQDKQSGRVVVHLFERGTRKPIPHALVRIIGSADKKFRTGRTDLRGIFTATGVRGTATVIAKKSDDFVFYRGKTFLGYPHFLKRRRSRWRKNKRSFDMLYNINRGNSVLQQRGRKQLERLYKESSQGVRLKSLR